MAEYEGQMRKRIEECRAIEGLNLDLDAALALWERSLELPGASAGLREEHHWFDGDIVAEDLLLNDGQLCGLLDFGGSGWAIQR